MVAAIKNHPTLLYIVYKKSPPPQLWNPISPTGAVHTGEKYTDSIIYKTYYNYINTLSKDLSKIYKISVTPEIFNLSK